MTSLEMIGDTIADVRVEVVGVYNCSSVDPIIGIFDPSTVTKLLLFLLLFMCMLCCCATSEAIIVVEAPESGND